MQKLIRDLKDTPFSLDRLLVWSIGITLLVSTIGIITLALKGLPESKVLNNLATFSLGSFVTMITRRKSE